MGKVLFKRQEEVCTLTSYKDSCPIGWTDSARRPWSTKKSGKWFGAKQVITTKEEDIKKFYGDLTKEILIERFTLVVEQNDNSIGLKFYFFERYRKIGMKYFVVRKRLQYLTFNTKYNNFYHGTRLRKEKKLLQSTVKTNDWIGITSSMTQIPQLINSILFTQENELNPSKYLDNTIGSEQGWIILNYALRVFFDTIDIKKGLEPSFNFSTRVDDKLATYLFSKYLEFNNIGKPDEWGKFVNYYISKKYLTKYGSLVEATMKSTKLKGVKVRRILNQEKNADMTTMIVLQNFLGVDYFNLIDDDVFTKTNTPIARSIIEILNFELTKSEKLNFVKLLNRGLPFRLLEDHMKFKEQLLGYGEIVKLKATNRKEFDDEHYTWTDLISSYKNGKVVRIYEGMMKEELEQPIIGPHLDYYPVLLTTSEDYNGESQHQNNCVRTYVEDSNNFIISLRESSPDGDTRATVEFKYMKGKSPKNVQSYGRFNEHLSSNWDYVLEEIKNRVSRLYEKNVIVTPKMTKEFANGKIIKRKSIWVDYDKLGHNYFKGQKLEWDNKDECDTHQFFDLDFF